MRRRLILAMAIVAACFLCSCGSNNTFSPVVGGCSLPAIANKLFGKTWIGVFDCAGTKRLLRLAFSQSGCNVMVTGQCLVYNGTSFPSFPGSGTADPHTGTPNAGVPVTINGNSATFAPSILCANPTNNHTIIPQLGILVVPGTTFTLSCTVTITDNSLTGTYSTQQAAAANQQGTICFAPEAVSTADVSGHWTGSMTGTTNNSVGPGTLDFTLSMSGNLINLASQGTLTTSEVTVQLNPPTGVSGVVIGNQVLFGITFIRQSNGQTDQIQHRWCFGTISGNTITGEFSDIVNPQGQGTFTISHM